MRIKTDGYYTPGDEDWVLACMYMSAKEIIENKLVANDYNGDDYDWITLPEREDGPKEYLVAAFGGAASELAKTNGQNLTTVTDMAYYSEGVIYGETAVPSEWWWRLYRAAVEKAGRVFDEDAEKEYKEYMENKYGF